VVEVLLGKIIQVVLVVKEEQVEGVITLIHLEVLQEDVVQTQELQEEQDHKPDLVDPQEQIQDLVVVGEIG
jgi:hypothetical protein